MNRGGGAVRPRGCLERNHHFHPRTTPGWTPESLPGSIPESSPGSIPETSRGPFGSHPPGVIQGSSGDHLGAIGTIQGSFLGSFWVSFLGCLGVVLGDPGGYHEASGGHSKVTWGLPGYIFSSFYMIFRRYVSLKSI